MQQQLRQVGIGAGHRSFDSPLLRRCVKGAFQLTLAWVGARKILTFFIRFPLIQLPPNTRTEAYVNPEMDRLIEAGRSTVDQEKRKQITPKSSGFWRETCLTSISGLR